VNHTLLLKGLTFDSRSTLGSRQAIEYLISPVALRHMKFSVLPRSLSAEYFSRLVECRDTNPPLSLPDTFLKYNNPFFA
jgi:hypothetical protein